MSGMSGIVQQANLDLKGDARAFELWANEQRPMIEAALAQTMQQTDFAEVAQHSPLVDAMTHGLMNGGKRVRALSVLVAGQLFGADEATLLRVAVALECVHAYSLIHDDMPCMDDDDLRRGLPTVHVKFGDAMALLAGDALQTLAFSVLSAQDLNVSAITQVQLMRSLAQAAGTAGMAGGQAIDCHNVGLPMALADMQRMHRLKTGALLQASLHMGALCGEQDAAKLAHLDDYAQHLGLLFQVVDDILDATQDSATLGKTAGKDEKANKPTYVRALGLNEAKSFAHDLYERAMAALSTFEPQRAQRLADLAAFCMQRVH